SAPRPAPPAVQDSRREAKMGMKVPGVEKLADKNQSRLSPNQSIYSQGFVRVIVGPDKTTFTLHRGLLCRCFKYFNALLNGAFMESSNDIVELPEEDPGVFEIVHMWLYTSQLAHSVDGKDRPCSFLQLVNLYIFGDKFHSEGLRIDAIDQLILRVAEDKKYIPNPAYVYENTAASSPLRKLLVATYAHHQPSLAKLLQSHPDHFQDCPEALKDIVVALAEKDPSENTLTMSKAPFVMFYCTYHEHDTTDPSQCRQMWIGDNDEDTTSSLTLEGLRALADDNRSSFDRRILQIS
ncbi:MAG: hypothetical protein Q9217_003235, partial [Psora testacea]